MQQVDYRQGDYRVVADRLRPAAEQLVAWCAPAPGDLVVDVAAGTGNVARLCAARGATAVAVDRVLEQLQLGRPDAPAGVRWVVGDAQALPLPDGIAAAALSTFGAVFADRPDVALAELARVCRPGGLVGLTTWRAGSHQAVAGAVLQAALGSPAADADDSTVWATAEGIRRRLSAVADDVQVRTGQLVGCWPSVDAWWASRVATAPPVVSARRQLDDQAFTELGRRLREVARAYGEQTTDGFVLRDGYLLARGRA